jgi:hypothetical protein
MQISLSVDSTYTSAAYLVPKLGIELDLFTTNLADVDNLHFVRNQPGYSGAISRSSLQHQSSPTTTSNTLSQIRVSLDDAGCKISTLTLRHDIVNPKAQRVLQRGVVKPLQISPYLLNVGDLRRRPN